MYGMPVRCSREYCFLLIDFNLSGMIFACFYYHSYQLRPELFGTVVEFVGNACTIPVTGRSNV